MVGKMDTSFVLKMISDLRIWAPYFCAILDGAGRIFGSVLLVLKDCSLSFVTLITFSSYIFLDAPFRVYYASSFTAIDLFL